MQHTDSQERACVCVFLAGKGAGHLLIQVVVAWTAMYLTSYSDYLTGFCEPSSQPYRCHTSLENVVHNHWSNISTASLPPQGQLCTKASLTGNGD